MTRLKLLIAGLFAVALVTGVLVGMGVSRSPQAPHRGSWLTQELGLTAAQSEQLKAIWSSGTRSAPGQSRVERRQALQKERDEAVVALFTVEQKAKYDQIQKDFEDKRAALDAEREAAFKAAVEHTRALLTDAQRAKYDELVKNGFRVGHGEGGWHGASTRRGGGVEGGGGSASGTVPAESDTGGTK